MKYLILLVLAFGAQYAYSQENYEIQVYGSQTQQKKSTIFELHSNYTFDGEKNVVDGVRPTYHALHETIEITHGITRNFELGLYLFTNYTSPYGFNIIGTHIRPRIMAPAEWNLPVGLSLSGEVGYQKPEYSSETWSVEIRPIIDKQWDKLYVSLNPVFGVTLAGINKPSAPAFAPNIKASYQFFGNASLGVEYYGDLGPLNNIETYQQQNHALFFVYDLMNNKDWELNAGPGFGLTKATDGFVFKILVGRKIYWGHHKQRA
ncbi:MAG: hypothetical protein J0I09_02575 [Sphingobacteriia bacterium]|nr:hypothetical protein [Sphingobacteriia bacterium]